MKKLISIALVAVMAAGGAVSANAAVKQNKDYQILSSKITTKNNTISIYTYNMKNTGSDGGFVLDGQKSGKRYKYIFKNYLSAPKTITMPSNEKYNNILLLAVSNCICINEKSSHLLIKKLHCQNIFYIMYKVRKN